MHVKQKTLWLEYGIITVVTLLGGLLRYLLWDFFSLKEDFPLISILYSFISLSVGWEFFRGVNLFLNRQLPFENGIARRMVVQLLIGVLFMWGLNWLLFEVISHYVQEMIANRIFYLTTYATNAIVSLLINSIFFGKYFFDQWKSGILKAERLEKEKTQVQFDNLKNQLNPHFLFNSMSSLHSLIFDNPTLASDFVQNLSKVYRYVLKNEQKTLVPLEEELVFIEHFVFLLMTRFQKGIQIKFEIDPSQKELGIVPVSLQVLLENAIKHNILDPEQPLQITIRAAHQLIEVANSVNLKKSVGTSNKKGLSNLQSLYQFLSSKEVEVLDSGDIFAVRLPLLPIPTRF